MQQIEAQMMIRKPVAEVFRSLIDPAHTTRFWFSKSSGKLEPDARVKWEWEMYGASSDVEVKAIEVNKRILLQWDGTKMLEFTFQALGPDRTLVRAKDGPFDDVAKALDSKGGFSFLLAAMKAYLEHGIELNLVLDHVPDALLAGWK